VKVSPVHTHELALSLGYLGSALGVAMVVPQIVRIARHPKLAGVSPMTWAISTVSCLLWLTYGARTHQIPQVPGNAILISGAAAIVLLVPSSRSRAWRAAVLGGAAAGLVIVALAIPAHDVGYLAFSIGLFAAIPQLADSVQTWRIGATSGVSVSSWGLKIASQSAWFLYGIGVGDRPVMISTCVNVSTAALLVILEKSARAGQAAPEFGLAPELVS
jgi:uncharacterized protein with PQ loop repeat